LQALEWQVAIEVTYSEFGERGSIDVLGTRRDLMAMAIIEVKSELTVVDATVRKLDEKVRIVRRSLGRDRFGFTPHHVGRVLILPSTETARRRVCEDSQRFSMRGFRIEERQFGIGYDHRKAILPVSCSSRIPTQVVIHPEVVGQSASDGGRRARIQRSDSRWVEVLDVALPGL
jgi:hypothetical protein